MRIYLIALQLHVSKNDWVSLCTASQWLKCCEFIWIDLNANRHYLISIKCYSLEIYCFLHSITSSIPVVPGSLERDRKLLILCLKTHLVACCLPFAAQAFTFQLMCRNNWIKTMMEFMLRLCIMRQCAKCSRRHRRRPTFDNTLLAWSAQHITSTNWYVSKNRNICKLSNLMHMPCSHHSALDNKIVRIKCHLPLYKTLNKKPNKN